jgi:hypothetical protein
VYTYGPQGIGYGEKEYKCRKIEKELTKETLVFWVCLGRYWRSFTGFNIYVVRELMCTSYLLDIDYFS